MNQTTAAQTSASHKAIPKLDDEQVLALLMLDNEHTDLCDINTRHVNDVIALGLTAPGGRPLTGAGLEAARFYGGDDPCDVIASIMEGDDNAVRPLWDDGLARGPQRRGECWTPEPKGLPR